MNFARVIRLLAAAIVGSLCLTALHVQADGPASMPATGPASNPSSNPSSKPASQPVDAKAVAELIRMLGSDSFKVRTETTDKLIEMGEAIAPLLKDKLKEPKLDLEVEERIKTVLGKILKSPLAGTTVTDEATGITVSIVGGRKVIATQAGKALWVVQTGTDLSALRLDNGRVILVPANAAVAVSGGGMAFDLATGKRLPGP